VIPRHELTNSKSHSKKSSAQLEVKPFSKKTSLHSEAKSLSEIHDPEMDYGDLFEDYDFKTGLREIFYFYAG